MSNRPNEPSPDVFRLFVKTIGLLLMTGSGLCTGYVIIKAGQDPQGGSTVGAAPVIGLPFFGIGAYLYFAVGRRKS